MPSTQERVSICLDRHRGGFSVCRGVGLKATGMKNESAGGIKGEV